MRRRGSRTKAHGRSISLRPLGASSGHPEHRSVTPREEDQRPDSLPRSLVATTRRRGMIPSRAWLLCRRASTCTLLTLAGRVRYAPRTHGLGSVRSLPPARTVRARRREAYLRSVDALANPPAIPVHSQRNRELASARGGRSAATSAPRPLVARHDKQSGERGDKQSSLDARECLRFAARTRVKSEVTEMKAVCTAVCAADVFGGRRSPGA
jgi:hypothetical protein